MTATGLLVRADDRRFAAFTTIVSVVALAFLGWLLMWREAETTGGGLGFMPAVNAVLNAISAACLALGYTMAKRRRYDIHKYLMVGAFAASALFLVGYVIYHYVHGDTSFSGPPTWRMIYLAILASHVILSIAVVPGALTSFYLAYTHRYVTHRKLNRVFLPIWLYVSVTGVLIYFLLHVAFK